MPLTIEEIRERFSQSGAADEITPQDVEQAIADVRRERNEKIKKEIINKNRINA